MGIRLRRRDPVMPGAAPRPGAKRSHLTGLARTLRTRWWPRIALAGVVPTVIGATLLKGAAQAGIALLGARVFLFALLDGLGVHYRDPVNAEQGRYQMTLGRSSEIGTRRETPAPPGDNGPG
jgi:hypothetical protein